MKRIFLIVPVLVFVALLAAPAQPIPVADTTKNMLKQHISLLASDLFEGRETGTQGEKLAFTYLMTAFEEAGLTPAGDNGGWLQRFTFTLKTVIGDSTAMTVNDKPLVVEKDFFPLAYSANATATGTVVDVGYGIVAPPIAYDDYEKADVKGHIALMELSTPEGSNPHSKYAEFAGLRSKIETAIEKGAVAVIFVNSDKDTESPVAEYKHKIAPTDIPVVFVTNKDLLKKGGTQTVTVSTELKKISSTGHNVIGFLDKGARTTVVIGAHYDHLGYGDDGSLYRGEPAIHNGADDNASGTAALVELARILAVTKGLKNNFLFIAFSGEEKGLLGSNHFVKHPTIDLATVNYMINMDMVGRLKPDERKLTVLGAGTSPAWKPILDKMDVDSIHIVESESGVGPSDHTSFYLKDIPVLHFFTGSHSDYHKPSDDEDKINYDGEVSVMKIMLSVIRQADSQGKLAFAKTKDSDGEAVPRFKVTLGVVPDYSFEGEGMRIDGVSDGKPASHAGLLAGDIVVQLGDHKVVDMMSYMKALSKFSKGDTTVVKVKRGDQEVEKELTF